jgi:hypothetical protein
VLDDVKWKLVTQKYTIKSQHVMANELTGVALLGGAVATCVVVTAWVVVATAVVVAATIVLRGRFGVGAAALLGASVAADSHAECGPWE